MWIVHYFANKEKYCQICTCLVQFISLYLFVPIFAVKLKDANYKTHWNISVFSNQWKIMSDLNMSHEKMSHFVLFPLSGFTINTTEKISILKGIDKSFKKWCQAWKCPLKYCLIWFKLLCLSRILVISWEIQILNFIKIVSYSLEFVVRSKFVPFFALFVFLWHYYRNSFELKKFLMMLGYIKTM